MFFLLVYLINFLLPVLLFDMLYYSSLQLSLPKMANSFYQLKGTAVQHIQNIQYQ